MGHRESGHRAAEHGAPTLPTASTGLRAGSRPDCGPTCAGDRAEGCAGAAAGREASEGRSRGASTHGGPAREGQGAVARAALQHSYGAVRGDCERGHGRACGSAEHPGLKRGAFLIRIFIVTGLAQAGALVEKYGLVELSTVGDSTTHCGQRGQPDLLRRLAAGTVPGLPPHRTLRGTPRGQGRKNGTCLFPVPNSTRASTKNWLVPVSSSKAKKSRKIRLSAMIRLGPEVKGCNSLTRAFAFEAAVGLSCRPELVCPSMFQTLYAQSNVSVCGHKSFGTYPSIPFVPPCITIPEESVDVQFSASRKRTFKARERRRARTV